MTTMKHINPNRIVLCILDGWGLAPDSPGNAIHHTAKNWQQFLEKYPWTSLKASEEAVGLPKGQMGNSEVGHMSMGLGRSVTQNLPRIDQAIAEDTLKDKAAVQGLLSKLSQTKGTCHLMGLLSEGGVHAHQDHFFATIKILKDAGIPTKIHAFLDGRDTPPQSALTALKSLKPFLEDTIQLTSLSGRYYAMDRDERWERTRKAYECLTTGQAEHHFATPAQAVNFFYEKGIKDEFIPPCIIGIQPTPMQDEDGLWMINFRADRVRQLLRAFLRPDFSFFQRRHFIKWAAAISMTEYASDLTPLLTPIFPTIPLNNSLGEIIAHAKQAQLRIAETEKYAHVTFFFNGGREQPFDQEDRILIASPSVATYDLQPAMSAQAITDAAIHAMQEKKHQLIVMNYANTDMVGHSGCLPATEQAVEAVDDCLLQLEQAALKNNWLLAITADHGNAEHMLDQENQPHTAHTCNPVPFLLIGSKVTALRSNGSLCDIAPTVLELLQYPRPPEITGQSLLMPL